MSAIAPFDFEGRAVRVVEDETGLPWFVARDVCECLELRNVAMAVNRLDEDERSNVSTADTSPSSRETITALAVNEPGLYSLTLTSRKPEAKRFKRWITHEVLPALRKTGSYSLEGAEPEPPTVPLAPQHRADVLVSASRSFQALLRTGCALRMSHARAVSAANAATLHATGIDLVQEMGAGDLALETGSAGLLTDPAEDFSGTAQVLAWLEGRDAVTIAGALDGKPKQTIISRPVSLPRRRDSRQRVSVIPAEVHINDKREVTYMTGRLLFKWTLGACIFAYACVSNAKGDPIAGSCMLKEPQVYRPWRGEGFAKVISHIDCVWSERSMLLIGETHGTKETLDLVTALIEQQPRTSKIAIGLEVPSTEDERLRQFLKSPPTKEATDNLLASDFWSYKDGRASQALLRFIKKVNEMNKNGRDIEVFGIEDVLSGRRSQDPVANKELGMAAILKKRAELGQKLIAVGGNYHIRIETPASANSTAVPNQLRSYSPYVLLLTSSYGTAWTCITMSDCGVHPRPQGMKSPSDEALLKPTEESSIYIENLDLPLMTASPPAK